jgi:hypothetical protein
MIISGLSSTETRAVNTVMSRAFFPRAHEWIYPRLAGSFTSVSMVEPFSIIGSVPPMQRYSGILASSDISDFSLMSPNPLWKNLLEISQSRYEADQTGTVVQLGQALGIRLAQLPDQLFLGRILKGSTMVTQTFEGKTYNCTMDGVPLFSPYHPTLDSGGTFSNVIAGSLPVTSAVVLGSDPAAIAANMVNDFTRLLAAIKDVKDTKGVPLFPNLDTKKSIVVVVPSCLEYAATLAFRTPGAVAAGTGGTGSTTQIGSAFVKDVISTGYLDGFFDPDNVGLTASPVNQTDWYVFITDDYVKPLYMQLFRPMRKEERFPPGIGSGGDEVDAIVKQFGAIRPDEATVFASTRIDTTFSKLGANSDFHTIATDSFAMSARWRGNVVYGPPFLSWRVYPAANGGLITPASISGSSSSSHS